MEEWVGPAVWCVKCTFGTIILRGQHDVPVCRVRDPWRNCVRRTATRPSSPFAVSCKIRLRSGLRSSALEVDPRIGQDIEYDISRIWRAVGYAEDVDELTPMRLRVSERQTSRTKPPP
jgi:hypothetical protein